MRIERKDKHRIEIYMMKEAMERHVYSVHVSNILN